MSAKCGSCTKTVYPMDPQISLDGCIFHKTCAKCADCNCQITISNFTKNGTTLLCKTHYFQRFRVEGNYLGGEKYTQKSTRDNGGVSPVRGRSPVPAAASPPPPAAEDDPAPAMSVKDRMKKFGSMSGANKVPCGACNGNVFPNDPQITLDGIKFHKECAKCADCKCQITIANFTKSDKLLLCKIHYNERFSKEGGYIGGEKFAKKTGRNANSPVPVADTTAPAPSKAEFTPVAAASVTELLPPAPVEERVHEAAPDASAEPEGHVPAVVEETPASSGVEPEAEAAAPVEEEAGPVEDAQPTDVSESGVEHEAQHSVESAEPSGQPTEASVAPSETTGEVSLAAVETVQEEDTSAAPEETVKPVEDVEEAQEVIPTPAAAPPAEEMTEEGKQEEAESV